MRDRFAMNRRALLQAAGAAALTGISGCRTAIDAAAIGDSADPARATATALARALRRRSISATELCQNAITRIERLDVQVNAVVVRDFERALADARAADKALARGDTRPLLGVPATVKEAFDLQGHATTFGLEEFRSHRANADAEVVRRMRQAGAVILGKTNVPVGLGDWQTVNPIHGRTNNPYDLSRTPGGSSGGAAAALAMGFSALEVGSDFGGSLRVPATFCGVFGLKPSFGAISLIGHAPGGASRAPQEMLVAGPMARSAEDLALLLKVIAGPDRNTPATALNFPEPRGRRTSDYRIFILDDYPPATLDTSIRSALESVEIELIRVGAHVARASARFPDLAALTQTTRQIARTRIQRQSPTTAREWFELLDQQLELRRRWAYFFEEFDVVVTPAFGTTAFPHTDEPDARRTLLIDGKAQPFGVQAAWTSIASVANLPAAVAPVGMDRNGLPIGLQVIAPFLGDLTAIRFAGLIARELPPPALAVGSRSM